MSIITSRFLKDRYPLLINQIHPTLNTHIDLNNLTCGSRNIIWWKCPVHTTCDEHIWAKSVNSKVISAKKNNNGCPFCAHINENICLCDSVELLCPDLLVEFNQAKTLNPDWNKNIDLSKLSMGSPQICMWKCDHSTCDQHVWPATINARTNGSGCPWCSTADDRCCVCDSFGYKYPKLLEDFNRAKNFNPEFNHGLNPFALSTGSGTICHWMCPHTTCNKHIWKTRINHRTSGNTTIIGSECPVCINSRGNVCPCNSFGLLYPKLLEQFNQARLFNPEYNKDLDPFTLSPGSGIMCWWKCPDAKCDHHIWEATLNHRCLSETNCCFCTIGLKTKTCRCDSFGTLFPNLEKEFYYPLNDNLDPFALSKGSGIKCMWQCIKCQCLWPARIVSRTYKIGSGCPHCRFSHLERAMSEVLKQLDIAFIPGKRFPDCINKKELPFDFYIPSYNILIEMDGIQHFEIVYFDGKTPSDLSNQQIRDRIKTMYCRNTNKHLLRISCTEIDNVKTHFVDFFENVKKSNEMLEKFIGEEYLEQEYIDKVSHN